MTSKEINFKGWKALEVRKGELALVFTPQVGGRISGCSYAGHELFYTQPQFEGILPHGPGTFEELKKTKVEQGFRFYGGYKTWLSPQEEWPEALPFYDLDSGPFEWSQEKTRHEIRVRMTSPVCRESGVELQKEVILRSRDSFVTIIQTMTNRSEKAVSHGLWDVTQVLRPGYVFMPVKADSQFPSGVKLFRTENDDEAAVLNHVRLEKDFAAVQCDNETLFKVGTDAEEGWLAGFFSSGGGQWTVFKKTFQVFPGRPCGHGCTAEVFNSDERPHLEMEVHAPLAKLHPGESFTWEGRWSFAGTSELPRTRADLESFI